jgi:hypothetical protein
MDIIREHLMYKNSPLHICMSRISPQEQYEVIRIVLESKTTEITICKHGSTNSYIDTLLSKLNVTVHEGGGNNSCKSLTNTSSLISVGV